MTMEEKVEQLVHCITLLNESMRLIVQQCVQEGKKVRLLEEKVESLETKLFRAQDREGAA